MNTIRRKATSIFLVLAMLASFIPAGALPAQAANGTLEQVDGVYQITDADDLLAFAVIANTHDGRTANAVLTADIDLTGKTWSPIDGADYGYSGTFDGAGKVIRNLKIDNTSGHVGLFGTVGSGGVVKDLTVSGTITGGDYVGAIASSNAGGRIENCVNKAIVNGNFYVGGIVGSNYSGGTVSGCSNEDAVNGSGEDIGGIAGYNSSSSVENCKNTAIVSGTGDESKNIGGIVGYNSGGKVSGCSNEGDVSASGEQIGGIVGLQESGSSVESCRNNAYVKGYDTVGGIVGQSSSTVINCYNSGKVEGTSNFLIISGIGGIVGYNFNSVANCYNKGEVIASGNDFASNVCGIVGNSGNSITNCYYLTDSAAYAGGGTAKDATAFASGEIAWLLQGTQAETVWVQSDLGQSDSWPELAALASQNDKQVFKVRFTVDGADYITPKYVGSGDTVSLPESNPTPADGSGFVGWKDADGQFVTAETPITADITCTPRWGEIYNVTLNTDGGTIAQGKDVKEYISGLGATLPTAGDITKDGCTFDGWYDNVNCTGTAVTEISDIEEGNKIYYAKWLDGNTGVTYVTVAGKAATQNGTTFNVTLPADATLTTDANDIDITTADNSAEASTPVTTDNGETWTFTVTAENNTTTQTYTIKVTIAAPSITTQPANQTVTEGGTATFNVAANVAGVNYQVAGV